MTERRAARLLDALWNVGQIKNVRELRKLTSF
jgi:hypothetical protein